MIIRQSAPHASLVTKARSFTAVSRFGIGAASPLGNGRREAYRHGEDTSS